MLNSAYPFILVDEYQDTNKELVNQLISVTDSLSVLGFYGDAWQKIYDDGVGAIESPYIELISKQSNFRSSNCVIDVLNKIRPNLEQVGDKNYKGNINVFHTNSFKGERLTGNHWKGDLPEDETNIVLEKIQEALDWDFSNSKETKILLLTNKMISKYGSI